MKNHPFYILVLLTIGTLIPSCTSKLDINLPDDESKIVAIVNYEVGNVFKFQLTQSQSIVSEDQIKTLDNALIEIYSGEDLLETITESEEDNNSIYCSDVISESNVEYTIFVISEELGSVTSKAIAPTSVPLKSFSVENVRSTQKPTSNLIDYDFNLVASFDDPPESDNYYHLVASPRILAGIIGGMQQYSTLNSKFNFKETFSADFAYTNHFKSGILFTDETFNGNSISFSLPSNFSGEAEIDIDNILLELRHVSKDYYSYHKSVSIQQESLENGAPFTEPTIIFNNIEGGYGNFAGYTNDFEEVRFTQ